MIQTEKLDEEQIALLQSVQTSAMRLTNLLRGWSHEIKEFLGALGVNSIESMRGSRERLRGIGLDAQTLDILGVKPAGR